MEMYHNKFEMNMYQITMCMSRFVVQIVINVAHSKRLKKLR